MPDGEQRGEDRSGEPLLVFLLGPLEVRRGDERVHVGGPKARAVLALLALEVGRVVSTARLIEGIWGEDAPDGAPATLQVHVSNLRRVLGAGVLVNRSPGYVLDLDPAQVDLECFEADVRRARAARDRGEAAGAKEQLEEALGRWRGEALSDLLDAPFSATVRPWLEERRTLAVEEHAEASLALGLHRDVVAPLEAAVTRSPHRERLWGQLMLALYRSGRQAEALAAYQRARRTLADELGIDPGAELRALEAAVLAQDRALDVVVAGAPAEPARALPDPEVTYRPPAQARWRLVVDGVAEHLLDGPVTLGRHPDCDICLPGISVSRRHAELRPALGGYLLIDLGSANGTQVNGTPALHHLLADGDAIGIGEHTLAYRSDPA